MLNKITGYGSVKNTDRTKKTSGAKPSSAFADILGAAGADEAAPTSQTSDVSATSAVSNMLALQEISDEDVRRGKLMQQGKNMLESLEDLRKQLLMGNIAPATLQNLARQLSVQRQQVNDPRLVSIMDDIELRVAVELAKLEKAAEESR